MFRDPPSSWLVRLYRWRVYCAGLCCLFPIAARADYTLYTLPDTDLKILLEGKLTFNPGGTVTLKHPRGLLYFNARDIEVVKSPSREAVFGRRLRALDKSQDVESMLELAKWALHNGMLDESKSLLSAAWKVDSSNPRLRKLAGLMHYVNRPVSDGANAEAHARALVGGRAMTATRSKHFVLLHDGDSEVDKVTRKTRAEMRLELLEQVYESYFLTFAFEGMFLRPPTDPMEVVLFSRHVDFMQMERRLSMGLRQVAGFYLPAENVSIFYDSGTTPQFKQLLGLTKSLNEIKEQMRRTRQPGGGELIRFANTVELLVDIQRESEDVSVVSHEAVHQLAANSNLFPRDGTFVRWVHEGLASFFESAKLARWSGVGVVDADRISYYRVLEGDPVRGSMEFVISDLGFVVEAVLGDQLPAYGQSWALTHFLFHEHFDGLMLFYRKIQEIPDEITVREKADKLLATFDDTFGDRATLQDEWRRYMRSLKTDRESLAADLGK